MMNDDDISFVESIKRIGEPVNLRPNEAHSDTLISLTTWVKESECSPREEKVFIELGEISSIGDRLVKFYSLYGRLPEEPEVAERLKLLLLLENSNCLYAHFGLQQQDDGDYIIVSASTYFGMLDSTLMKKLVFEILYQKIVCRKLIDKLKAEYERA